MGMIMRITVLVFTVLFMTCGVSHALNVSVSENSNSIGRYDIYELTMSHSHLYANPWEEVVIAAFFTAPSGKTYSVGGFYYDTDTWKLRFAPMEEGSWTWNLTIDSNGQSGTYTDSGGFTCVSSNNSGFLRIHPQNPFRFITDGDNKVFYPMGFNDVIYDQVAPSGIGKGSDGTLDSDWCMDMDYVGRTIDHYFDTFAAAGNNIFRMNTQLNTYVLWSDLNVNGTGKNTYAVVEGKLTDQLAQKLHDGGWKFYMVFWQKPNLGWDLSDQNVRQATLSYHKYVVDRWGAYVDIWELMNERKSQDDRYFDVVTTHIRDCDPYDHIISTSNQRPDVECIDVKCYWEGIRNVYWNSERDRNSGSVVKYLTTSNQERMTDTSFSLMGETCLVEHAASLFLRLDQLIERASCTFYYAN